MKKLLFHLILFVVMTCLFPQLTFAKTGYVSDMLLLTFRQGPGNSYASTKTLKSNTPVTILEEKNEFYKVELQSKEIGWVDKKFIIFELPKTFIIDQLKQENKILENKILKLKSTAQTLKEKILSQKNEYPQRTEQSKNIQKIVKENKMLKEKNLKLSKELKMLKEKNKDLFKIGMIKWFLAGLGVLLTGWIIGQSVSSKKYQSSSLLG